MSASLRTFIIVLIATFVVAGCASLARDPLQVTVAGIDPLQGQGLELRLNVKLRVQNPNDSALEYDGVALQMDVQGKTFATGVADVAGSVPRFGEAVITVPVTISAFRMARQVMGAVHGGGFSRIDYEMKGKLGGGFNPARFATRGSFELPASSSPSSP